MKRLLVFGLIIFSACRIYLLDAPSTKQQPVLITETTNTKYQFPAQTLDPIQTPSSLTDPTQILPSPSPLKTRIANEGLHSKSFHVVFHPDGQLYIGDQVSFEVIAPESPNLFGQKIEVYSGFEIETLLGEATFGRYGIGGRNQATFLWTWNTSSLPAGEHLLRFKILPDGPVFYEFVTLLPHGQTPPEESSAHWKTISVNCCEIHYIIGTAAERDLAKLSTVVQDLSIQASLKMGIRQVEPIEVTFIPRVLGHGGFALHDVEVSYLDRNYAGGDAATIIHHELIHILDSRLGGDYRPSAFVEGLAVYMTGGHYSPEPLMPRAAALLAPEPGCVEWNLALDLTFHNAEGCGLDVFIPLPALFDNFYAEQHEIGYLEAGALVEYLVNAKGWNAFSQFYRDIHRLKTANDLGSSDNKLTSQAVDQALRQHFGITLIQLEVDFKGALHQERLTTENAENVKQLVRYYDAVRQYQLVLDPSSHFLAAWLPDCEYMRQRNITEDFVRRLDKPENLALEAMLVYTNQRLLSGDYSEVDRTLTAVNAVLKAFPEQGIEAFKNSPLTLDYYDLIIAAMSAGYRPEKIELNSTNTATVWVPSSSLNLREITLTRNKGEWLFDLEALN